MSTRRSEPAHERLPRRRSRSIRRHGVETYPHECCGALLEVDGVIVDAFALPNTTAGRRAALPGRPDRLPAGRSQGAELKGRLAGFYHSHPDHPARPSQYDLDHAWPNFAT